MSGSILPADRPSARSSVLARLDAWAKRTLLSLLRRVRFGEIVVIEGQEQHVFGRRSEACDLRGSISVLHPRFYSQVVFGGGIGAGEAYMAGLWSSDDLPVLLRIILLNEMVFRGLDRGLSRLKTPIYKGYHFLHKDTRKDSRINIEQVRSLGYSETFIRMWEFYLCYCEAGFQERYLGDVQVLFAKPLWRGRSPLPPPGLIAPVFPLSTAPHSDVKSQPQSPDGDQ